MQFHFSDDLFFGDFELNSKCHHKNKSSITCNNLRIKPRLLLMFTFKIKDDFKII